MSPSLPRSPRHSPARQFCGSSRCRGPRGSAPKRRWRVRGHGAPRDKRGAWYHGDVLGWVSYGDVFVTIFSKCVEKWCSACFIDSKPFQPLWENIWKYGLDLNQNIMGFHTVSLFTYVFCNFRLNHSGYVWEAEPSWSSHWWHRIASAPESFQV